MTDKPIHNVNIVSERVLRTPAEIVSLLPRTPEIDGTVYDARRGVRDVLDRNDPRLLLLVGPCSIHDMDAGLEYATRLRELADEIGDVFLVLMRAYFEKPRTTVGWKGAINDPHLDDSFDMDEGLQRARKFLLDLARLRLPAGTEALNPIVPQYIGDLVAWTAIGARTTESQTHRELASGLSTPVGVKNGTDGSIRVAVDALKALSAPHHFLGITQNGQSAVFHTRGNQYGHIVLRGGNGPNHDPASIAACEKELVEAGLPANIMVDCSHANSGGDPERQPKVFRDCAEQIVEGNASIIGMMAESNLLGGNQPIPEDLSQLKRGMSVTDACLDFDSTAQMLRNAAGQLREVLAGRVASD
jgi:3-deoxy-7-phosphoheptulonate synthase